MILSELCSEIGQTTRSLAEILGAAHRNNRRDEITSALLIHRGEAVQMVEGARADLDRLVGRLRQDPRRINLRILSDRPVAQRRLRDPARLCASPGPAAESLLGGRRLSEMSADRLERIMASDQLQWAA